MLKQLRRLLDPPTCNGDACDTVRDAVEDLRRETARAETLLEAFRLDSVRVGARGRYLRRGGNP